MNSVANLVVIAGSLIGTKHSYWLSTLVDVVLKSECIEHREKTYN
jgi:hypothetical protein